MSKQTCCSTVHANSAIQSLATNLWVLQNCHVEIQTHAGMADLALGVLASKGGSHCPLLLFNEPGQSALLVQLVDVWKGLHRRTRCLQQSLCKVVQEAESVHAFKACRHL